MYWYNGDPNLDYSAGIYSTVNFDGTSMAYDNFSVVGGPITVTGIFGNFFSIVNTPVSADWEIRKGVSEGNGGTLVASGINASVTWTPINLGFQFPTTTYRATVSGLSVALSEDTYWVGLRAISDSVFTGFSVFLTTGGNAVGVPVLNDGNSFVNWTSGLPINFQDARTANGFRVPVDLSIGVLVADAIPEPGALWMAGAGLGILALRRKR